MTINTTTPATCSRCQKRTSRVVLVGKEARCEGCASLDLFPQGATLETRQSALLDAILQTKREMDLALRSTRKIGTVNGPLFGGQEELF